jgi:hypothetical protein
VQGRSVGWRGVEPEAPAAPVPDVASTVRPTLFR